MGLWIMGFASNLILCLQSALSSEILIEKVELPGATIEQEVTYSTSKNDYEAARDLRLSRMRRGDVGAFVNDPEPWRRVETTATIGFEYKGFGSASGRMNIRQISAAEEALFLFERK